MTTPTIFCPNCDALILAAARCAGCAWERPRARPSEAGAELWRAELPRPASTLTLAGGALYLCDAEGGLHARAADDGRPLWPAAFELGPWRIHRSVAVAEGLVMVGPADSRSLALPDKALLALDAGSGAVRWRAETGARDLSDPAVAGELVVTTASDGRALGFDVGTGKPRWSAPLPGICRAAPALTPEGLVFASAPATLTMHRPGADARAWQTELNAAGGWSAELPYTPVYREGRLYVTCWDGRCYAVDARTGARVWASEPTKRPPMTPPTLHAGRVYFCAHDRYVYCLDAETGALVWRQQMPRRANTTPLALDGAIYVVSEDHRCYAFDPATGAGLEAPPFRTVRHVGTDWACAGRVAHLVDADGTLYAVNLRPAPKAADGAELAAAGDWPAAAAAYALEGDLPAGAAIYARLGQARHAALLYARAGDAAQAAAQFEGAGELLAAREWHGKAGRLTDVARLSVALGDNVAARDALEAVGRAREAAGEWGEAADAYEASGALIPAARMRERAGERCAAGRLYARLGEHRRAAELFEAEGEWSAAAVEWRAAGVWLAAARAAEAAGELEAAAQAFTEAGACSRAADCLRLAAEGAEERGAEAEAVAALYEAAMNAYGECGAEDRAAACDRARRWRRRQPWLEVPLPAAESFVAGESGRVDVRVVNDGWGLAREITLSVSGRVALDLARANRPFPLQEGLDRTQTLWVIPERGGKLPLHLTVTCKDARGEAMPPFEISYEISVRGADERRSDGTTIIQVDRVIHAGGDYVEGDQAKVGREAGATLPPAAVVAAAPVRRIECHCGHAQGADRAKCEACGRPFFACRACGRYRVSPTRHCPYCGAAA